MADRTLDATRDQRRRALGLVTGALALGIPVAILVAQFLSLSVLHHLATPVGYDTPKYIWRANLVSARGLDALLSVPILHPNADRPAYPVLAALFHSTLGLSPFRSSFVLPAIMPAVIGLSGGAIAVMAMAEAVWAFPIYALVVGGSLNVAVMAVSHTDTLIVSAVVLAAAATALAAADGAGTIVASILLLTGATVVHWNFVVVFGLVLLALAAALIPESLRARRDGAALVATASGRLVGILGGSALLAGGALLLAPGGPRSPPPSRGLFVKRLHDVLPVYRLWAVGPIAAAGATSLWLSKDRRRRRALWFALIWCGAAVAAVALLQAGAAVAAHRIVGFTYAVPLLVAAALAALIRITWPSPRLAIRVGGIAVVAAALAFGAFLTQRQWFGSKASMPAAAFGQASTAGRYLDGLAGDRPVVVVLDGYPTFVPLATRVFRASVPPRYVASIYPYLGDPSELLAGRPTLRPGQDRFNKASLTNWAHLQPVLGRQPVILMVQALDERYGRLTTTNPDWPVAPGVAVIRGPRPTEQIVAAPTPTPPSPLALVLWAGGMLFVLAATGLGWAASLVPSGWLERVALSPAFGIAVLALGGVVADQLGIRFAGPVGILVAAAVAAAGWAIGAASRAIRRDRGSATAPAETAAANAR